MLQRWRHYKKRLMYAYLNGMHLGRWKQLIARLELHRRIKKRERI